MASEKLDEKAIFNVAREISPPDARREYVRQICGADNSLLERVETLLQAYEAQASFLESPPVAGVTPTVDQPIPEQAGAQIGPYKLLEQIGEGGMGVVYMAEQVEPVRRKVALKIIKPGMDTRQVIARFEAERQALSLMDHPNIAKVLEAGSTDSGRPCFVMELVKGQPITEYCDDHHLTPRQRLEMFVPVCQAIQHAHQKGVIHRDIKPSNILVAEYDQQAAPKVIDFGVAKAISQPLTEKTMFTGFGQIVGTLEYMSPEQARVNQLDVDTRSDIYSLGVLLYELLTGSTPFDKQRLRSAAFDQMLRIIREEEPPKPSTRLSESKDSLPSVSAQRQTEPAKLTKLVRGELDWIVMKALEKDRARRYETANGFAQDVQRYLADETVQACPPSVGYRLRKFVRRNRRGLAAAGVLGLALMIAVGAVSGSVGWVVSDRAARWKETYRTVNVALSESNRLQDQLKPGEALLQVQQASAILASGASTPELQQRVQKRLDDLTFVMQLEEIRADHGRGGGEYSPDGLAKTDRRFAAAFRQFDIDFDSLSPDEAARRLRQRTVPVEVAAAMDAWAWVVRNANGDKSRWQRLLAVARAIDPEPMRSQLRVIVEQDDKEALQALLKTIRVEELSAQTALFFASALEAAGSQEDALKVLLLAQLRHPADRWLCKHLSIRQVGRSSGPPEDGLRFAALSAALQPESAVNHYILGATLLDMGRVDEAIAACREAIRRKPDDAGAHNFLGKGLQSQGDLEGAIAAYREAIRLKPDYVGAHEDLGELFAQQGKFDDAIACWREALRLTPQRRSFAAVAHTNIGNLLARQGKWSAALASFREAVGAKPDHAIAHNQTAWLLATCPDRSVRDAAQAVEFAQKAVALAPQEAEPRNTLGVAHYRAGNLKEAIAALEASVAMRKGGDGCDWFFLAMAHWQLGDKDEARKAYEQAVEWMEKNQPKDEELRRFRAEAEELLGTE